jgi:hypothetical protein
LERDLQTAAGQKGLRHNPHEQATEPQAEFAETAVASTALAGSAVRNILLADSAVADAGVLRTAAEKIPAAKTAPADYLTGTAFSYTATPRTDEGRYEPMSARTPEDAQQKVTAVQQPLSDRPRGRWRLPLLLCLSGLFVAGASLGVVRFSGHDFFGAVPWGTGVKQMVRPAEATPEVTATSDARPAAAPAVQAHQPAALYELPSPGRSPEIAPNEPGKSVENVQLPQAGEANSSLLGSPSERGSPVPVAATAPETSAATSPSDALPPMVTVPPAISSPETTESTSTLGTTPPTANPASGACKPELRALNLCGKVTERP